MNNTDFFTSNLFTYVFLNYRRQSSMEACEILLKVLVALFSKICNTTVNDLIIKKDIKRYRLPVKVGFFSSEDEARECEHFYSSFRVPLTYKNLHLGFNWRVPSREILWQIASQYFFEEKLGILYKDFYKRFRNISTEQYNLFVTFLNSLEIEYTFNTLYVQTTDSLCYFITAAISDNEEFSSYSKELKFDVVPITFVYEIPGKKQDDTLIDFENMVVTSSTTISANPKVNEHIFGDECYDRWHAYFEEQERKIKINGVNKNG